MSAMKMSAPLHARIKLPESEPRGLAHLPRASPSTLGTKKTTPPGGGEEEGALFAPLDDDE